MIIRGLDLVRRTQIIFSPTRCRTFGLVVELGAQMGAKRGPGALFSIDFRPPWGGSAASIHHGRFPHFSQCDRVQIAPFALYSVETGGGTNDRVIDPFAAALWPTKVALAFNDRRSSREIHEILCQESHEGPLQPLGGGKGALWAAPGTIEIV